MVGQEVSFFVLANGSDALPLAAAEDHKTVFDDDRGPNTGGMGAYSPVAALDEGVEKRVMETIVRPTVAALAREGAPYRGVLYVGLMLTAEGPKVVEFNCRFGDPECQALSCARRATWFRCSSPRRGETRGRRRYHGLRGRRSPCALHRAAIRAVPDRASHPGLDAAEAMHGVQVFHAGTATRGGKRSPRAGASWA